MKRSKITTRICEIVRQKHAEGFTISQIADSLKYDYGISVGKTTISNIINRKGKYKYYDEYYNSQFHELCLDGLSIVEKMFILTTDFYPEYLENTLIEEILRELSL